MSNKNDITIHVREVLAMINEELLSSGNLLKRVCLRPVVEPIRESGAGSTRSIEVEISFSSGENAKSLVDMLSFFLVRNGEITASIDETRNWVKKDILSVVESAKRKCTQ